MSMDTGASSPGAGPALAAALAEQRAGRIDEAEAQYRNILCLFPACGEALHGLATVHLTRQSAAGEALVALDRALRAGDAESWRARYHLALALIRLRRAVEAVDVLLRANRDNPKSESPYRLLAAVLQELGRLSEAASVWVQLGQMLFRDRSPEAAMEAYREALSVEPGFAPAHMALAPLLRFYGRHAEAEASYQAVLNGNPGDLAARLGLCSARLRMIFATPEEVRACRDAYLGELARLHGIAAFASPEAIVAGAAAVGDCKPFYLSYQGFNDRDAQRLYGDFIHRAMSHHLPRFAGRPVVRPNPDGRKLRIGFATSYLYEHSVTKLFAGWAECLDRQQFEVYVYHFGSICDAYTDRFRNGAAGYVQGLPNTEAWAEAIRADELDALIFLDIGMLGQEVRLAPLRLAPVQFVAWGHPVTTGLPTVDYFLSSALMEPFNGADHYTETLVSLPNLSICYQPVSYPEEGLSRADLGLAPGDIAFTCCQSLFKYLPQYDVVFPAIARRLPAARFVFIRHHLPEVTAVFERRLEAAFRAVGLSAADHCRVVERVPRDAFGSFLACGDVYLDSIGWSGGNTTLEAMACDRPTVTLAADLMRGRHSTGILRRLGLDAFVVHSLGTYVDRAVELGRDEALRRRVSAHIAARKPSLYGDVEPVRALEALLRTAVRQRA